MNNIVCSNICVYNYFCLAFFKSCVEFTPVCSTLIIIPYLSKMQYQLYHFSHLLVVTDISFKVVALI